MHTGQTGHPVHMVGETYDDRQARAQGESGHRLVPHTADVRIEAWGTTWENCLVEAVLGMVDSFADVSAVRPTAVQRAPFQPGPQFLPGDRPRRLVTAHHPARAVAGGVEGVAAGDSGEYVRGRAHGAGDQHRLAELPYVSGEDPLQLPARQALVSSRQCGE